MIEIKDKKNCSACTACVSICPQKCITMKEDEEGFLYPETHREKCVNCGLCQSVCQHIHFPEKKDIPMAYAGYNKNEDLREKSSSGGVFTLLAESILNEGGAVYGAGFDKDFILHHMCIENINDLEKLRGSKYMQSIMGDTFPKIKKQLETGKKVLFTGTPCQCEGLLRYLKKKYENLYIQDIICHGVPSGKLWNKYLEDKKINKYDLEKISFRDKKTGWKDYSLLFKYRSGENVREKAKETSYMRAFIKNASLRYSCYNCKVKSLGRHSDITLGDFWGVEYVLPEMEKNMGVSLILVHSDKGENLLSKVKENMVITPVNPLDGIKYNKSAVNVPDIPKMRASFYQNAENKGIEKAVKKAVKPKISVTVKNILKKVIGKQKKY